MCNSFFSTNNVWRPGESRGGDERKKKILFEPWSYLVSWLQKGCRCSLDSCRTPAICFQWGECFAHHSCNPTADPRSSKILSGQVSKVASSRRSFSQISFGKQATGPWKNSRSFAALLCRWQIAGGGSIPRWSRGSLKWWSAEKQRAPTKKKRKNSRSFGWVREGDVLCRKSLRDFCWDNQCGDGWTTFDSSSAHSGMGPGICMADGWALRSSSCDAFVYDDGNGNSCYDLGMGLWGCGHLISLDRHHEDRWGVDRLQIRPDPRAPARYSPWDPLLVGVDSPTKDSVPGPKESSCESWPDRCH